MRELELTDDDRLIYEREIAPWLPPRMFDAHSHLMIDRCHPGLPDTMAMADDPLLVDVDLPWLEHWWATLLPDIDVRAMVMGFPTVDVLMADENRIVAEQCATTNHRFAWLVKPSDPLDRLEADILQYRPSVLKPYMCFVEGMPINEARITDLIPEGQLALADAYGLAVMLHVAKPSGMGDPVNLRDIGRLAAEYPNCLRAAGCRSCPPVPASSS